MCFVLQDNWDEDELFFFNFNLESTLAEELWRRLYLSFWCLSYVKCDVKVSMKINLDKKSVL